VKIKPGDVKLRASGRSVVCELVYLHCCIRNGRNPNWKMGLALYYALPQLATKIRASWENSRLAGGRAKSGWGKGIHSWETEMMSKSAHASPHSSPLVQLTGPLHCLQDGTSHTQGHRWLRLSPTPRHPPVPHGRGGATTALPSTATPTSPLLSFSSSSGSPRSRRGHHLTIAHCPLPPDLLYSHRR
jgi:hypothetical protein